jgi:predicted nucleotide-binding protein
MKDNTKPKAAQTIEKGKRAQLSQSDVPSMSLENALRVPQAIFDNYAGGPVTSIQLAQALNMTPTSGPFRMLCGAAIAYGLTAGGYNAGQISVEPLAKKIFRPLEEGEDVAANREAFLKPRIINEFLIKYNGHALPNVTIAKNVLSTMGVPEGRTQDVLDMILEGAVSLGFVTAIKDKKYVQLNNPSQPLPNVISISTEDEADELTQKIDRQEIATPAKQPQLHIVTQPSSEQLSSAPGATKNNKVFVTHGKNKNFVEPIKELLTYGKFEPIVSVERQANSKPVPDKVMDDMRSCSAAIIHVDAEMQLKDDEGNIHPVLNPNVLIEIGAAMALYGKRFILLVKNGTTLPSNLQGLYEVRYEGDSLDAKETIHLLKAIDEMSKAI